MCGTSRVRRLTSPALEFIDNPIRTEYPFHVGKCNLDLAQRPSILRGQYQPLLSPWERRPFAGGCFRLWFIGIIRSMTNIRLGTRGSVLARRQADWTTDALQKLGCDVEIVVIKTSGDFRQDGPIGSIGAPGVFTKELQRTLLDKTIDVAVHSLKDLPTEPLDGLSLGAVPKRGPHRDVFVSNTAKTIDKLPHGCVIGTGSLRRKTQILYRFGDRFRIEDVRGNVETRLRKLDEGRIDALLLAEAGLVRLGLSDRIASFLEPPVFLPAVGQGALGLEIRCGDTETAAVIAPLNDSATFAAVRAERAMLRKLQGGCIAPIAALGTVVNDQLTLLGRILSLDGSKMFEQTASAALSELPESLGIRLAESLLENGADEIINDLVRQRTPNHEP